MRFLGRREDMPQVIAAADILALTSDREALPYIVLEAMAGGLPVVATAAGAVPEVVTSDVGIVVPPGDSVALATAIGKLAADGSLRSALGTAGRARQLSLFSSETMCGLYADAIVRTVYGAS